MLSNFFASKSEYLYYDNYNSVLGKVTAMMATIASMY